MVGPSCANRQFSMTANTWLNDKGVTSTPAGICKK
jgi:hypothetical protein